MNHDIAVQWADALESGKFTQGYTFLKQENLYSEDESNPPQHCVLGVLCELAYEANAVPARRDFEGVWYFKNSDCAIPQVVQEWAGLGSRDVRIHLTASDISHLPPNLQAGPIKYNVDTLNDEGRWPLAKFADYIRDQWEEL